MMPPPKPNVTGNVKVISTNVKISFIHAVIITIYLHSGPLN